MTENQRQSPVQFSVPALDAEERDRWPVVLEYADEGQGPHLVDLSHLTRWDLQDRDLQQFRPGGVVVPERPGSCAFGNGVLVNRMNRTQASIWHLNPGEPPGPPSESALTDVTEATVFLALFGPGVFSIGEKLTALDLSRPEPKPPFLIQGPFSRVPCQIVVLERSGETDGGLLFTCSRGYAADMVDSVLSAGREFGLRPAGEKAFLRWLSSVFPETE